MPGPVPKRSQERRRRNKIEGATTASTSAAPVKAPAAPPGHHERCPVCIGKGIMQDDAVCPRCEGDGQIFVKLHPIAGAWYRSLRTSGQAQFYEPSDWQMARFLAHEMSRSLSRGISAETIRALLAGMTELLVSEGARRRARLELERGEAAAPLAPVAVMDNYRDALG